MAKVSAESLIALENGLTKANEFVRRYQYAFDAKYDIDPVLIEILQFLNSSVGVDRKMKDVGAHVSVKLSNLTNLIDRMEHMRVAKRSSSKTDRRSVHVEITPKGKKVLEIYSEGMRAFTELMAGNLTEEQFNSLIDGLDKAMEIEMPRNNALIEDEQA